MEDKYLSLAFWLSWMIYASLLIIASRIRDKTNKEVTDGSK
jgi:hypothetical protein